MAGNRRYNSDGPSAEERALERFTELMIKKISSIKGDWKKPWFTEGFMTWPKNLSGREYNGMNALMLMLLCEENGYKLPVFCTFQRVSGLNYSTD
ncbi:ArdC family protein, partial [Bacteroides uniformis]